MTPRPMPTHVGAFLLILSGTVLGIAGIDLVLPAVPTLPAVLGGTAAEAQFVLAAYVAGTAAGLLAMGEVGARVDPRRTLAVALGLFGLLSLAAARLASLEALIALRFAQGLAGAAPAVFAPSFVRALFPQHQVRAIGLVGSIEALVPALAPIAGVALLARFGWQGAFVATGVPALVVAGLLALIAGRLPDIRAGRAPGGYGSLLRNPAFRRHGSAQALALGALLVFVFGAPTVIVEAMGGRLQDFIMLQVAGIACFILAANLSGWLAGRLGTEAVIWSGTLVSAFGALLLVAEGLAGGDRPAWLIPPAMLMNLGFGMRGPPGFLAALQAAGDDDARGAALVILGILLVAAVGTAVAAPTVQAGLLGVALVSAGIATGAVLCLLTPGSRPLHP